MVTFQVGSDLKIGGFSYGLTWNWPAEKNCQPILSSLINSTLYNSGTFVLQQAYCNIACGELRSISN